MLKLTLKLPVEEEEIEALAYGKKDKEIIAVYPGDRDQGKPYPVSYLFFIESDHKQIGGKQA